MTKSVQQKLHEFIAKDKFSDEAWEERGLNSSGPEISNKMSVLINNCAHNLLKAQSQNFKDSLISDLNQVDPIEFDTEEREFIIDLLFELSKICSVDIAQDLNAWMYGEIVEHLKTLPNLDLNDWPDGIVRTICVRCGQKMNADIVSREEKFSGFAYFIIKCNKCREYNLLDFGPGVSHFVHGTTYEIAEILLKKDYTKEQVNARLNKLRTRD